MLVASTYTRPHSPRSIFGIVEGISILDSHARTSHRTPTHHLLFKTSTNISKHPTDTKHTPKHTPPTRPCSPSSQHCQRQRHLARPPPPPQAPKASRLLKSIPSQVPWLLLSLMYDSPPSPYPVSKVLLPARIASRPRLWLRVHYHTLPPLPPFLAPKVFWLPGSPSSTAADL
jgi:hypothetical protein